MAELKCTSSKSASLLAVAAIVLCAMAAMAQNATEKWGAFKISRVSPSTRVI